jgi:hypothetical protein
MLIPYIDKCRLAQTKIYWNETFRYINTSWWLIYEYPKLVGW